MSDCVYHYTDTGRLPFILASGELRPGRNRIGSFPQPDFLWATASRVGDRTSAANAAAFRKGVTRWVRFGLQAGDFLPFREAISDSSTWTEEHLTRLVANAREMGTSEAEIATWLVRPDPLPRTRWLAIETRSWSDRTWRPMDADSVPLRGDLNGAPGYLGLRFGKVTYWSKRSGEVMGADQYDVGTTVEN